MNYVLPAVTVAADEAAEQIVDERLTVTRAAFAAARADLGPDATVDEVRAHADWLLAERTVNALDPACITRAAKALTAAEGNVWDSLPPVTRTQQRGLAMAVVAGYHGISD